MNQIFDACVWLLEWLARLTGLTYEQVNVWIFCVVWPLVTCVMGVEIIRLRRINKSNNARQNPRDPRGLR